MRVAEAVINPQAITCRVTSLPIHSPEREVKPITRKMICTDRRMISVLVLVLATAMRVALWRVSLLRRVFSRTARSSARVSMTIIDPPKQPNAARKIQRKSSTAKVVPPVIDLRLVFEPPNSALLISGVLQGLFVERVLGNFLV